MVTLPRSYLAFARGTDSVVGVVQELFEGKSPDFVLTEEALGNELKASIDTGILTAALSPEIVALGDATANSRQVFLH